LGHSTILVQFSKLARTIRSLFGTHKGADPERYGEPCQHSGPIPLYRSVRHLHRDANCHGALWRAEARIDLALERPKKSLIVDKPAGGLQAAAREPAWLKHHKHLPADAYHDLFNPAVMSDRARVSLLQ
jgi:hypothetical protein